MVIRRMIWQLQWMAKLWDRGSGGCRTGLRNRRRRKPLVQVSKTGVMLNVQHVFLTHAIKLARNSRDQWQVRLSSPRDANSGAHWVELFVASDKHNALSESQNRLDDIRQSIFAIPTCDHSKQHKPQQFHYQGPEHQAVLLQQQESDERAEQEHLMHLQIIAESDLQLLVRLLAPVTSTSQAWAETRPRTKSAMARQWCLLRSCTKNFHLTMMVSWK